MFNTMKSQLHEAHTTVVAKINDVKIVVIENGEKRVAIKPICEALGIAFEPQFAKLKNDEILGSTITLSVTVGSDGKNREMTTIPFKFVFGWLFTINSKNVREEAREAVTKYKLACYEALYNHFAYQNDFLEDRQRAIDAKLEEVKRIRSDFNATKSKLKEANEQLDAIRKVSYQEWLDNKRQFVIPFPEYAEEGGAA
jgi:hypothetical protein